MRSVPAIGLAVVLALAACSAPAAVAEPTITIGVSDEAVEVLLDKASTTVLGQDVEYPTGRPEVTMSVVTIQPGAATGLHHHDAPLAAWILEGTLIVDYGPAGERTYEPGDAFLEAVETRHDGRNDGTGPVRILVVNLGSDSVANTVTDDAGAGR